MVGLAIYVGGVWLDLRRFFQWTGIFIIFVAAGILARAVGNLHEAGLWNGLQGHAYDMSAILPISSLLGTILSGVFSYQENPTVGEVIVYLTFLTVTLYFYLRPARPVHDSAHHTRVTPMSAPDAGKGKPTAPSARLMYLGVAGAAGLVLVAGAAFYFATLKTHGEMSSGAVQVAITSKACEPNAISVLAGERTFEIANKSDRPVEWEILDGVMVVAERENIAPSFKQTLKVRLAPGDYEVTCGLLSNPRGTLRVGHSEEANATPARATMRNFQGRYRNINSTSAAKAAQRFAVPPSLPTQSRLETWQGAGALRNRSSAV